MHPALRGHGLCQSSCVRFTRGRHWPPAAPPLSAPAPFRSLLKANITIQLATMCMAGCSMISGWFGMNLDNGVCGPEGCIVNGITDHGHSLFVNVVTISTAVMFACGLVVWFRMLSSVG